ncbi:MAG: hypothetical protein JJT89_02270 [Nitriliruptoraceae bacterium]|nr:hypothetical protein [Nitriliruptoraceae bacterium]
MYDEGHAIEPERQPEQPLERAQPLDPDRLTAHVRDHPGVLVRELATDLDVGVDLVHAHLAHLETCGQVNVGELGTVRPGTSVRPAHRPSSEESAVMAALERRGPATGTELLALEPGAIGWLGQVDQVDEVATRLVRWGFLTRGGQGAYDLAVPRAARPDPGPIGSPPARLTSQAAAGAASSQRRYVGDAQVGGRTIARTLDAAAYWVAGIALFFIASQIGGALPVLIGIGAIVYGLVIFAGEGTYWVSSVVYVLALFAVIGAFTAVFG